MTSARSAALVLAGSLGAASAAMAAMPVVHHRAHPAEAARAAPVEGMAEAPDAHPSLTAVFAASDAPFHTPMPHDPSRGLLVWAIVR